ncbi:MAG: hypothetical protein HY868_18815 [Chloroflexi bacterium]|nr:hypothetical protein [Chloroflexota bacterium]
MKLEINHQVVADPVNPDDLARWMRDLPDDDQVIVVLSRGNEMLQAAGAPASGFALNYQDLQRKQSWASKNSALKAPTVIRVFMRFARGEWSWRSEVAWQMPATPPWAKWFDIPPGLAALFIFTPITFVALWFSSRSDAPGTLPFSEAAPRALVGIAMIAGYTQYVDIFFRHIRPRVKNALARALGAQIVESGPEVSLFAEGMAADHWEVTGKAQPGKVVLVWIADGALLIVGLIGPVAAFCIPGFLLAERLGIK